MSTMCTIDVHDAAQAMQRLQRDAPVDPPLDREQKVDRDPQEDHVLRGGLRGLQDATHAPSDVHREVREKDQERDRKNSDEQADGDRDASAHQALGLPDALEHELRVLADSMELVRDLAEPRFWEALGNPTPKRGERLQDQIEPELAVSALGVSSRAAHRPT
jgi:hypothetical protein